MTFEKAKKYIDNPEKYLVRLDGEFIFEYAIASVDQGYDKSVFITSDDEVDIDKFSLEELEVYTYKELDLTLENIVKAIKDKEKSDPRHLIVVFDDGNFEISDLEARVFYSGVSNVVDRIVQLKKVNVA